MTTTASADERTKGTEVRRKREALPPLKRCIGCGRSNLLWNDAVVSGGVKNEATGQTWAVCKHCAGDMMSAHGVTSAGAFSVPRCFKCDRTENSGAGRCMTSIDFGGGVGTHVCNRCQRYGTFRFSNWHWYLIAAGIGLLIMLIAYGASQAG